MSTALPRGAGVARLLDVRDALLLPPEVPGLIIEAQRKVKADRMRFAAVSP